MTMVNATTRRSSESARPAGSPPSGMNRGAMRISSHARPNPPVPPSAANQSRVGQALPPGASACQSKESRLLYSTPRGSGPSACHGSYRNRNRICRHGHRCVSGLSGSPRHLRGHRRVQNRPPAARRIAHLRAAVGADAGPRRRARRPRFHHRTGRRRARERCHLHRGRHAAATLRGSQPRVPRSGRQEYRRRHGWFEISRRRQQIDGAGRLRQPRGDPGARRSQRPAPRRPHPLRRCQQSGVPARRLAPSPIRFTPTAS